MKINISVTCKWLIVFRRKFSLLFQMILFSSRRYSLLEVSTRYAKTLIISKSVESKLNEQKSSQPMYLALLYLTLL